MRHRPIANATQMVGRRIPWLGLALVALLAADAEAQVVPADYTPSTFSLSDFAESGNDIVADKDVANVVTPVAYTSQIDCDCGLTDCDACQTGSICDCGSVACDGCGTGKSRHWFATYESVIVQPVQSNSTGVIVQTDDGYSHVRFPWELSHSPRVSFGSKAIGGDLGWRMRYWQFRHSQGFLADDENGLIPLGTEATAGYLSEDGDITTGLAFIQEGEFTSGIRTDVLDAEIQREVTRQFNLFAGLRYAKVAQSYAASTDQGIIAAASEFRGIGPTLAMRFDQPVYHQKVSLFSELRGSLLMGGRDFNVGDDVNLINQSLGTLSPGSAQDRIDAIVNNGEIQLGVQVRPTDWLSWHTALECQYYGNVGGPNPTGVFTGPDSGLAGDSPLDDSLGFVGLTAGLNLRY